MDASNAQTSSVSLTASLEKLALSSVRFSGAATLYGVHQFESAMNLWQESGGIGKQMDQFGVTVNSLTQCLADDISPGKKEALISITEMTTKMVQQSVEGMSLFDPRLAFRFATALAKRSSEAIAGWTGQTETSSEQEPKLAAEVLTS
ncbi:MAG: hypothetical protein HY316_06035 [Acidobacteria bacterium]|nr:hypothetical protein [Acidobacteriota bacterium]